MSTKREMEKENVAQIHKEFYSDVRKNEVARCTGKWLEPENVMSSKQGSEGGTLLSHMQVEVSVC